MFNKAIKLTAHFLVLALLATPLAAFAENNGDENHEAPEEVAIELFGEVTDEGVVALEWAVDGTADNGFKVLVSETDGDLTYPPENDESDVVFTADEVFEDDPAAGDYYYRVCAYDGDGGNHGCSNVLEVLVEELDEEPVDEEPADEEPIDDDEVYIELWADFTDKGYVVLEWEIDGDAPHGVKVLRSDHNDDLTYPPLQGDKAHFVSDAYKGRYEDWGVKEGYEYFYRICAYLGDGECGAHSNVVEVYVDGEVDGDHHDDKHDKKDKYMDKVHDKVSDKKHNYKDSELDALRAEIKALKEQVKNLKKAFKDIAHHKYSGAIDYLREKSIVQGYEDDTYKPDNKINRAEFMKIVVGERYKNELSEDEVDCFEDVGLAWYSPYVCLGKEKGIVSGYGDGNFRPGQHISFVEAAKILSNVYDLDLGDDGSQWYERYVRALQKKNYVPSSVGKLDKPITRAEMAELIWRIKEQKQDQEDVDLLD